MNLLDVSLWFRKGLTPNICAARIVRADAFGGLAVIDISCDQEPSAARPEGNGTDETQEQFDLLIKAQGVSKPTLDERDGEHHCDKRVQVDLRTTHWLQNDASGWFSP